MKSLPKAIIAMLLLSIAGCGGAYWWSDYSVMIFLSDGTIIECSRGISLSDDSGSGYTTCYKETGFEYIHTEKINKIIFLRKSEEAK